MRNHTDEVTLKLGFCAKSLRNFLEFKEGRKEPVIKGFVRNTHI